MKPVSLSHNDSMIEIQLPKQTVLSPLSIFCIFCSGDNEIMLKIKLAKGAKWADSGGHMKNWRELHWYMQIQWVKVSGGERGKENVKENKSGKREAWRGWHREESGCFTPDAMAQIWSVTHTSSLWTDGFYAACAHTLTHKCVYTHIKTHTSRAAN